MDLAIGSIDENDLSAILRALEANIKIGVNSTVQLLSNNFLYAVVCILKRYELTGDGQMLWNLKKLMHTICQYYPLEKVTLIQMGIVQILAEILKKEIEYQTYNHAKTESDGMLISGHIISVFFPAISDPDYHYINLSSNEIICKGSDRTKTTAEEITSVLKDTFLIIYNICQMTNCPTAYQILLLKMLYWAENVNVLPNLVPIEELIRFTKVLIDRNPIHKDSMVIGFAIVDLLLNKHLKYLIVGRTFELLKAKYTIASAWLKEGQIFRIYSLLVTYWLSGETVSRARFDDEFLTCLLKDINFPLEFVMSAAEDGRMNLDARYRALRELLKKLLYLPEDILSHKGKMAVSSEGIKEFNRFISHVMNIFDVILIRYDLFEICPDLCDLDEDLPNPVALTDIRLGLYYSHSFDRVLGSSKSPEDLRSNALVRTLRLLSILYEVNENWGILFGSLSTERLVDKSCFISNVLDEAMNNLQIKKNLPNSMILTSIFDLAVKYPFLMSLKHRHYFFKCQLSRFELAKVTRNVVSKRGKVLDLVSSNLDNAVKFANHVWKIIFFGEQAVGEGPTKEFYSEFSRDCQRFDRGLWSGEPGEVFDGVSYVKSESGLFPSPRLSADSNANSSLTAIGVIMAKSLIDNRQLDINFSNAFYKCLFQSNPYVQHLSIIDIKDVMPSIYKFVQSLVEALREKWIIKNYVNMAPEEQNQAMSNITCDGCSFEDLCVNFTLPGFPDIEMMEGGSDTFLSIDNLDMYLQLLVWWLLYKNPQQSIKEISNGFRRILNPYFMKCFYPDEYDELLCGLTKEQWTVDFLKQNVILKRLTAKAPMVQNLFEVLSSLSASDQRNFLKFVTSNPRLPVGGMAALKPKLTISRKGADGNPDNYLPSSSTCHNTLFITMYSSKKILEEKLVQAIREGTNSFHFS